MWEAHWDYLKKKNLNTFINNLKSDGPELQLELTIIFFKLKIKIIEINVNYSDRLGVSNYTGNLIGSFKVALKFTKVVFVKLFKIWLRIFIKILKPFR